MNNCPMEKDSAWGRAGERKTYKSVNGRITPYREPYRASRYWCTRRAIDAVCGYWQSCVITCEGAKVNHNVSLRAYCAKSKDKRITPELVNPCAVGQNGADWHPSCMGELCGYLSLQAQWIIVPNYLRLVTARCYNIKPIKLLELWINMYHVMNGSTN